MASGRISSQNGCRSGFEEGFADSERSGSSYQLLRAIISCVLTRDLVFRRRRIALEGRVELDLRVGKGFYGTWGGECR